MEGYKFVPSPYCGCFKPEDVPKTEPLSTSQSVNNIPASLPSLLQFQLQQFQLQQFQQQLLQLQQSQQQLVQLPTVPQQVTTVVPINTRVQQPIITNPTPNNCNSITQCTPSQRFDEATCQCVCIQQAQCHFRFQVFNPTTCQCEPNECPNTCSNCETQNSLTCECVPLPSVITCPAGKALDPQTCQCICNSNIQCNALQQLNPVTCQCECRSFTETVEQTIPSLGGRANNRIRIANPRPTSIETSEDRSNTHRRHRGRTHSHRGGRHRHGGRGRRASYEQDIAMYFNRQELLSRQKRVKETGGTGTQSRSGSRRSKSNSRRVDVARQQQLINTITITRQVSVCPIGKRSILSTCTCI